MAKNIIFSADFNTPTYVNGNLTGQGNPAWIGMSPFSSFPVVSNALKLTTGAGANHRPAASIGDSYIEFDLTFSIVGSTGSYVVIHLRDTNVASYTSRAITSQIYADGSATIKYRTTDGGTNYTAASYPAGTISFSNNVAKRIGLQAIGTTTTIPTLFVDNVPLTPPASINIPYVGTCGFLGNASGSSITIENFEWGSITADVGFTNPVGMFPGF